MNSFNHYSLGSVGEWLYRHVAGIELDPDVQGFRRFVLKPWPEKGLDHVRASYRSMAGEIASEWRRSGETLEWNVRIPANSAARVCVPSEPGTEVVAAHVPPAGREGRFAVYELGSGAYRFRSIWRG